MIIQVSGLKKFHMRMSFCDYVSKPIDSVNQNPGKKKIWENNYATISKLGNMFKARFDQGESNTGISDFTPTKTKAFPKQACYFRYI